MTNVYNHQLNIQGMHCHSCELIIKDGLEELPEIKSVEADYKKGTLEIKSESGSLDKLAIDRLLKKFGYI